MSIKRPLIEIGLDKNGEFDFGITCGIGSLSVEQMNELRAMIVVAIGTAEDMFRCENERRNPAASAIPEVKNFGPNLTSAGHPNG